MRMELVSTGSGSRMFARSSTAARASHNASTRRNWPAPALFVRVRRELCWSPGGARLFCLMGNGPGYVLTQEERHPVADEKQSLAISCWGSLGGA